MYVNVCRYVMYLCINEERKREREKHMYALIQLREYTTAYSRSCKLLREYAIAYTEDVSACSFASMLLQAETSRVYVYIHKCVHILYMYVKRYRERERGGGRESERCLYALLRIVGLFCRI